MTHEEMDKYWDELVAIRKMPNSGDRNKAFIELGTRIGASGCPKDMSVGERDAEHVKSIHQAIQTATMIDMCKTSAKNYKVAIVAAIVAVLSALAAWTAIFFAK